MDTVFENQMDKKKENVNFAQTKFQTFGFNYQSALLTGRKTMKGVYRGLFNVCIWIIVGLLAGCQCNCNTPVFSFDVTSDMREFANTVLPLT